MLLGEQQLRCVEFEDLGDELQVADCAFEVVMFSLVVECISIEIGGQAEPSDLLCKNQVNDGLLKGRVLAEDACDGIKVVLDKLPGNCRLQPRKGKQRAHEQAQEWVRALYRRHGFAILQDQGVDCVIELGSCDGIHNCIALRRWSSCCTTSHLLSVFLPLLDSEVHQV